MKSLLARHILPVSKNLKNIISEKSLRVKKVGSFNPETALDIIRKRENSEIMAFDIGGDKIARQNFRVKSGDLVPVGSIETKKGINGDTYLDFLQDSPKSSLVGISCAATELSGTVLVESPNISTFTETLKAKLNGDFAKLFPESKVSVNNDAVAGAKAAGMEAYKRNPDIKNVLFVINGGGFGMSVLTKDSKSQKWSVLATEPGHVQLPKDLNPLRQDKVCGVGGATYTCVENVVASGAGIEDIYFRKTGKKLNGKEISKLYQQGNNLATELYDTSAIALAQTVYLAEKMLRLDPKDTAIACHGGAFEVPGYIERVSQLLKNYSQQSRSTFKSMEFSENAGLTGAAIASLAL